MVWELIMRINKFIASSGLCSRRKADELIKDGKVTVNENKIVDLGYGVLKDDIIRVNGVIVKPVEQKVYYMMNKPKGYVTSLSDEKGRKTVMDLLGDIPYRVYPIGRLDYDTEGLLLFTNDGDLSYKLTSASSNINKTYIVKIEGNIKESELAVIRSGIVVDGVKYDKCELDVIGQDDKYTKLQMVIHEGKNRQIRKTFEHIGKNVVFLKRIAIGQLRLGGLSRGKVKMLNENDLAYLLKNKTE